MHDGTGPQRQTMPGDGWVEVELPFPGVRQFEEEFAPNLATDGLFIPTSEPLPPSTVVRVHVTLPDEFVLLEGTGVVVWSRQPGDPSGAPPGMSLRFATLSQHYQDLLDRIVQTHVERGGVPFEVEPRVGDEAHGPGAELPSDAARGVASERARLTVRRAGAPDEVSVGRGREAPSAGGDLAFAGPYDQTVSLPPWDRAPAPVPEPEPPRHPESDVEVPVENWPPWETFDAVHTDLDTPDGGDGGMATPPAVAEPPLDDIDSDAPMDLEPEGPAAIPEELFSDDVGESTGPDRTPDKPVARPPMTVPEPFTEGEAPARRWSMGRTLATLAAAIVVVGVVALLVLSPWSRFVDQEAEPVDPVTVASGSAVGVSEPVLQDDTAAAVPEPEAAGPEDANAPSSDAAEGADAMSVQPQPAPVEVPPASRIESITWDATGATTRVTVRGDGTLRPDRVAVIPMDSPPRVLIRIRHITTRYESYVLEVGSPQVTTIRTGLHPELSPPALYVVCDLAAGSVRAVDSSFDGSTLTVTLGS
jgi:uncharacterized protein (TIGR02266 family)